MSDETRQIAGRLKEIREACGYTLEETALRLGIVTEQYIGYEENGENIPISVLYKLATDYGVDINELLTGKSPKLDTYCVVRKDKSPVIDRHPGYHFESLAFRFKRRIMEPLMVIVEPNDTAAALITHTGQEFNYVIEGAVTVTLGGDIITLEEGDCVYFDPSIPHGQRAAGSKTAKFLTVIAE